jgi:hypothetical protein
VRAEHITTVAFYGPKPAPLQRLLTAVRALVTDRLGGAFRPYDLDQIHATIVGLDAVEDPHTGRLVNQHLLRHAGLARPIDHAALLRILATGVTPPMTVRIGGFRRAARPTFTSRGAHPYDRSFTAQGDALVLMGWPTETVRNGAARLPLDHLRRSVRPANVLHRYHPTPDSIDNDFYLVVGHQRGADPAAVTEAAESVRAHLAGHPVELPVGVADLAVVAADSTTLAPARFAARLPLDPAALAALYH